MPKTCLCGGKYTVFKTNDMSELEDAAKSFEQVKEFIDMLSLTCIQNSSSKNSSMRKM